jgi:outer membrane protease
MNLKKSVSALIATALFLSALSAQTIILQSSDEESHEKWFSIEPVFSIRNGYLGEYVLLKDPIYSDNKLSYLEWQIKNELMAGIKAEGGYKKTVFSLSANFGFPQSSGIVMDSDWFNNDSASVASTSGYNYKTHYSESDNNIDYDFDINIKAGWKFKPAGFVSIIPSLGFSYSQTKFTAKEGWNKYGKEIAGTGSPYSPSSEAAVSSFAGLGTVLEYHREQSIVWLGADFQFTLPDNFFINAGLWAAPYSYTFNTDNHPYSEVRGFQGVYFVDICDGWFSAWKFNLSTGLNFTKKLSASLNIEYFLLTQITGDSYTKNYEEKTYTHHTVQMGGADAQTYTLSLSAKYKIEK